MNIQIKQRIVGVVIVVALIALLIPFLFVGKKNKDDTLKLDIPQPQSQKVEISTAVADDHSQSVLNTIGESSAPNEVLKPVTAVAPQVPESVVPTANKTTVINQEVVTVPVPVPAKVNPPASAAVSVPKVENTPIKTNEPSKVSAPVKSAPEMLGAAKEMVIDNKSTDELVLDSLNQGKKTAEIVTPNNVEPMVKQEQKVMDLSPKQPVAKYLKNTKETKAKKNSKRKNKDKKPVKTSTKTKIEPVKSSAITKPVEELTAKTDPEKSLVKMDAIKDSIATGEVWSVYLGNFPEKEEAALVKKMYNRGYRVYPKKMKTPDGAFVEMYVGHLRTRTQAEELALELEKVVGLSGEVVKSN